MLLREFYLVNKLLFINQWWGAGKLRIFQDKRLREIIKYAYENVPFYNNMFKKLSLAPSMIKSVDDLKKLPIITKETVSYNLNDFISKKTNLKKCIKKDSSGSTGIPTITYYDLKNYDYVEAVYARAFFIQGVKPWDRIAYFWYKPFDNKRIWEHLGLMKKNLILFTEPSHIQIKRLLSLKPTVIHCFPSTLYIIAKEVKNERLTIRPRLIITHGETLNMETKRFIEKIFQCKVLDLYGLSEFTRVAWECPVGGGYHIDADYVVVEVLKNNLAPAKSGESGTIVITSLFNFAMPLIRYSTGDIGVVSSQDKCVCGRSFPKLSTIEGRRDDFVVLPLGKMVSPRRLLDSIQIGANFNTDEFNNKIYKYRIIQKRRDNFEVYLVPRRNFIEEEFIKKIETRIRNSFREDKIEVLVKVVEDLPYTRHGKHKILISEVLK